MSRYDAVMFDLDGTLLPMDPDGFGKCYFGLLAKEVTALGYDGKAFLDTMWRGVGAMVKNDGKRKNEELFWEILASAFGDGIYKDISTIDEFYKNDFHLAKAFTGENPLAKEAIRLARNKGDKVILATNPFFPTEAVKSRLSWIGLGYGDFDFVTDYSNSGYCKPNPKYYLDVAAKNGVDPKRCLMVGNNTEEDIVAAAKAGFDTYLIIDCLICEKEMPECKSGSFADFLDFIDKA